jgi:hypothetical protein
LAELKNLRVASAGNQPIFKATNVLTKHIDEFDLTIQWLERVADAYSNADVDSTEVGDHSAMTEIIKLAQAAVLPSSEDPQAHAVRFFLKVIIASEPPDYLPIDDITQEHYKELLKFCLSPQ